MSPSSVAIVALAVAAFALAFPGLVWLLGVTREIVNPSYPADQSIPPADRASWVNRLFALAAAADGAGEPHVASAARALITALVSHQEPSKKGK